MSMELLSRRLFIVLFAVGALVLALFLSLSYDVRHLLGLACALGAGLALAFLFRREGAMLPERSSRSALTEFPSSASIQTSEGFDERRALSNSVSNSAASSTAPASALLEATMSSMREGVIVVDHSLRVVASNRAARHIFSHVDGNIESLRLTELTRNSSIHTAFTAAINDQERAEVKVETRGADRRMLELRVEPLRLEPGAKARGAIGVFFDITQLERLERVRQEFLSNVSHELRTPLTAILAFVETLEDGAIDDADNNRRFLGVIRKNASRMHNLIDDILELSAIEAGTVTVEPTQVRLQPIVNDVITALAARAAAREITVLNEVGPDTMVLADARRLEQMITNLVDNAIKFNRDGGKVTISHERKGEGAEERDRICVRDTGDGIPAEHIDRIFERFYRVDRARSREMGGTGLGLAIVKHLTRAHGGEASVTSTLGEGSTFVIDLQTTHGGTTS